MSQAKCPGPKSGPNPGGHGAHELKGPGNHGPMNPWAHMPVKQWAHGPTRGPMCPRVPWAHEPTGMGQDKGPRQGPLALAVLLSLALGLFVPGQSLSGPIDMPEARARQDNSPGRGRHLALCYNIGGAWTLGKMLG